MLKSIVGRKPKPEGKKHVRCSFTLKPQTFSDLKETASYLEEDMSPIVEEAIQLHLARLRKGVKQDIPKTPKEGTE